MTTAIRPPRLLGKSFENDLLAGPLRPFLDLVQRDRDLIAEIRRDLLDIYCKGQRLVSIRPQSGSYRFESHEKFWPQKWLTFSSADAVASFCRDIVPFIKQRIAEHGARGKEIEYEQLLVRANNLETLNTDYIAVDRQGISEEGKGRTDVVGVYWPGDRRGSGDRLAPALIEVKYGLKGGIEDVADQIARYFNDMRTTLPDFVRHLENQLRQKARLGLLSGLSTGAQVKIQRLAISDKIEDVRAVIALIDFNPRARRLNLEKLRALPFADQIDLFHLGLGLWRSNSCFRVRSDDASDGLSEK
ncbi:hypothetical protein NKK48_29060 [Mesorhizobium sp. C386A]|uniref:hypothetical protein n=1 Tax=unclassified Mesorhizobium TaxID=325217 RepID=UPI0003CE04BA|nr:MULTISPECIES: hypothetical protein [unclassified Mesorhizobium]ESY09162.1 hypothetical protein X752_21155 [Mesorhizobium sp. LNJC398B00]ESY32072.1 hypothetical protein X748_24175 [Mesorhizobium sp. LNJC386A00]